MGEEKRAFKGVWICAAIFLDEKLTPAEKILLAEIDSLTTDDHGCYASNAHFARRLGVTASRVNHIVARLTREGTSFGCVMTAEFRTGLYRRSTAAIRLLHEG
jgi:Helix-turn-helix domain